MFGVIIQRYVSLWLITIAFVVCCTLSTSKADITPGSIVLLPFETQQAGKYEALKDGLRAMLAGRLSVKEGITVLDATLGANEKKTFIKNYPQNTQKTFAQLSADFVSLGMLSLTEEGLRLDIEVFPKEGEASEKIHVVADTDAAIIDAVGQLADDLAEKFFGHAQKDQVVALRQGDDSGIEAFQTAHPDRKYKEEIISGSAVFDGLEFAAIAKDDLIRRRSSLADGVVALSIGNIDGVGDDEIVVASEKNLKVFQYERGLLQQLATYDFSTDTQAHALNIADLDNDGITEIYVSATRADRFSSLILTWTKTAGFMEKQVGIRWAIRPMETPEDGMVLLGQARSRSNEYFFEPGIHLLEIDETANRLSRGKKLFVPRQFNIFDFVYADIDGNGISEIVGITSNLKLAVFDRENRLSWVSQTSFGGSVKYLGERWRTNFGDNFGNVQADDENLTELQYIPPRLVAQDVNGDGKTDIIGAKNILSTFEALTNFRAFSGGNVACLSWNGFEMKELWQTDVLDGYISDLDFMIDSSAIDVESEEKKGVLTNQIRLLVGQVPSGGFADMFNFLGDKANLVSYNFKILGNPEELNEEKQ